MKFSPLGYLQLPIFPKLITDYLSASTVLSPFYKYSFDLSTFKQTIADKKFPAESRHVLADALNKQYESIQTTTVVRNNLEKLGDSNTFCITTAHQPVIFTGPLYVIYKILSAINIAEQLCKAFPDKHFVPVYFMGAEDHDFEEINHTWINGDKIEWRQENKGAVGRLSTSKILPLIGEVENHLNGKPHAEEVIRLLKESYGNHSTLAEATLHLINSLFGAYGLVVLIPDNKALKELFAPVIEQELLYNHSFTLTQKTNEELGQLGYGIQVNPREINLFYLAEHVRERIVLNEQTGKYEVLNTSLSFGKEEILKMVKEHPENFSPNVMLRPLYQETILPNLAYVGGSGELSYWLQQKRIFEQYDVNFPMLVPRNAAMIVDSNTTRKINKSRVEFGELFKEEETLIQDFVKKHSSRTLDLAAEKKAITMVYDQIREKAVAIDQTLTGAIEAQKAGTLKGLEGLESKIMRAEKRNFETATNQIRSVRSKLFPGNILQERVENFLPWYANEGATFLQNLKREFDPFRKEFVIGVEES